jgi:hypothetical protein
MNYQDQLYGAFECPELGEIVYDRGQFCICKLGICEKKRSKLCSPGVCKKKKNVLWDDIDKIHISALKTYVYFVPASESISLNLVNKDGSRLSLGVSSGVRLKQEEKNLMDKVYSYVVSQVFNRQWNELIAELSRGEAVGGY